MKKINIEVNMQDSTELITLKQILEEWLKENFQQGDKAEVTILETENK